MRGHAAIRNLTRAGIEATRQVERDHRGTRVARDRHARTGRSDAIAQRPTMPRAQQSVHHHALVASGGRVCAVRVRDGLGAKGVRCTGRGGYLHADRHTRTRELRRDDVGIPTVVAAAHVERHTVRQTVAVLAQDERGTGTARVSHELKRRDASGDRRLVACRRFGSRGDAQRRHRMVTRAPCSTDTRGRRRAQTRTRPKSRFANPVAD